VLFEEEDDGWFRSRESLGDLSAENKEVGKYEPLVFSFDVNTSLLLENPWVEEVDEEEEERDEVDKSFCLEDE